MIAPKNYILQLIIFKKVEFSGSHYAGIGVATVVRCVIYEKIFRDHGSWFIGLLAQLVERTTLNHYAV